jgi:hypothetical protein
MAEFRCASSFSSKESSSVSTLLPRFIPLNLFTFQEQYPLPELLLFDAVTSFLFFSLTVTGGGGNGCSPLKFSGYFALSNTAIAFP